MKSVLGILAAVASLGYAQPPRDFYPWWDSPVSREIGLSEDQRARIEQVVREYRSKLIDLRAAVEKAEADLGDALNEEKFDLKRASEAADRVVKSRSELTAAFSQMSVRLRGILTVQQWRDLQRRRPQAGHGLGVGPQGPRPGQPQPKAMPPGQPGPRGPRRHQPAPPPQPPPPGPGPRPEQ